MDLFRPSLEAGDINRFPGPGNFASYARAVDSRRESNGKKKGAGNAECGDKHLAQAFIEAAHFAVRYDATIKQAIDPVDFVLPPPPAHVSIHLLPSAAFGVYQRML